MAFKHFVYHSILDVVKMGPRFFFQGLRAGQRSSTLSQVDVPGLGPIFVRPGDSDFESVRQVFRSQEYAIVITDVADRVRDAYSRILAAGKLPVIIDAGANIGAASLWFTREYPEAIVVSIEPEPGNVEILRRNTQGRDIQVLEAAIGSESGFVSVHNHGQSWGVQTTRSETGLSIVTVDDALNTITNGELFIVKVDIEGFESDLFESNTGWIDRSTAIYIEPHDWLFPGKRTSGAFQRELSKRNFELFINRENLVFVKQALP
jgi:FkbM family methyltransferase